MTLREHKLIINGFSVTGAPFMISFPHFYLGDPSLLEEVEGLNPDPEKHDFYLDVHEVKFCILLKVLLGIILVNNQLDALFLMYLFIYFTSLHFPSDRHTRQSPTQSDIYQMMY